MTAIQLQAHREGVRSLRRRGAVEGVRDATHGVLATFHLWRRRVRARHELARLDDLMLKDIGITHAEREVLANKPFWRE